MAGLEAKYVERTGVKSLKVRHNNILGFYIEVTQGNAKPLLEAPLSRRIPPSPDDGQCGALLDCRADRHRGAHRVRDRAGAEPGAGDLRRAGGGHRGRAPRRSARIAAALAELDATAGLAELARAEGYARPVVDDSQVFEIRGGRHPVVEQALKAAKAGAFIENDCVLGRRRAATAPATKSATGASGWSPAPTWPASRRSCARTRSSPSWRRWARTCRRARRRSARSTACSAASAPPTTWRAGARRSWWRWSRRPPSSIRRATARSSSSTRSAAARRPSTACRLPGRRSNSCTTCSARARCSPPTITS